MNAVPHTHEVYISQNFGHTRIAYGDTSMEISKHASERKIEKTVKKVIRKHDLGSQEAAAAEASRIRVQDAFNEKLTKYQGRYRKEPLEDLDEWPSVRMPEWEEEYEPEEPPAISPILGRVVSFDLSNDVVARSGDTLKLVFDEDVPVKSSLIIDEMRINSEEFEKSMRVAGRFFPGTMTKKEATE